jgi:hypothetical protein
MTHVMREELIRWRDQGRAEDRDRIVSHLASCKSCAAQYAELVRTAPSEQSPVRFDPADFVQRGYAVRNRSRVPSAVIPLMSWKPWTAGLSAAALLFLVLTIVPPSGYQSGTRGTEIELTSSGAAGQPPVIQWTTDIAAARFRVELLDPTQKPVYETVTETNQATVPADISAGLRPGGVYTWKVTALDSDGTAVTSASQTFSIAGDAR